MKCMVMAGIAQPSSEPTPLLSTFSCHRTPTFYPRVKCLTMSRDAFERVMGPVEQVGLLCQRCHAAIILLLLCPWFCLLLTLQAPRTPLGLHSNVPQPMLPLPQPDTVHDCGSADLAVPPVVLQVLASHIQQYAASNAQYAAGGGSGAASSSPTSLLSPGAASAAGLAAGTSHSTSKTAGTTAATTGPASPGGGTAALLPGSPRPSPSLASEGVGSGAGSFSRRRSGRSGRSGRSSASSEDGFASGGERSPTATATLAGWGAEAGAAADMEVEEGEGPIIHLPPIAEEPSDAAIAGTPRTSKPACKPTSSGSGAGTKPAVAAKQVAAARPAAVAKPAADSMRAGGVGGGKGGLAKGSPGPAKQGGAAKGSKKGGAVAGTKRKP